jgi:2C-methyl-D-erythritol 2,4-cyclodiphosphate synthase
MRTAISKAAHDNLGIDINLNDIGGMEELTTAMFSEPDIGRVQAFVRELEAAGINMDFATLADERPKMDYRVYEIPAEFCSALNDDVPSISRTLEQEMELRSPGKVSGDACAQFPRNQKDAPKGSESGSNVPNGASDQGLK